MPPYAKILLGLLAVALLVLAWVLYRRARRARLGRHANKTRERFIRGRSRRGGL